MRKLLVFAGLLSACTVLASCNPPAKQQVAAPCNCHGNEAAAGQTAENQGTGTAGAADQQYGATEQDQGAQAQQSGAQEGHYRSSSRSYSAHRGRGMRRYAGGGYSENHGYRERGYRHSYRYGHRHGYQGSDEDYARYWTSARASASSYDYRSTSRVYSTGASYDRSYTSDGAYASGGYIGESAYHDSGWEDGYGRTHAGTYLSRGAFAARMDPWHGYDVDCPDGDHHHHGYRHHY